MKTNTFIKLMIISCFTLINSIAGAGTPKIEYLKQEINKIESQIRSDNFRDALSNINRLKQECKDCPVELNLEIDILLAKVYHRQTKYKLSEKCAHQILAELDKNASSDIELRAKSLELVGRCKLILGHIDQARDAFMRLLKLESDTSSIHYNPIRSRALLGLGGIYLNTFNYAKAQSFLNAAKFLNGTSVKDKILHSEILKKLGYAYMSTNQFDLAQYYLDSALNFSKKEFGENSTALIDILNYHVQLHSRTRNHSKAQLKPL